MRKIGKQFQVLGAVLVPALAGAAAWLPASDASACGGFFCSQASPVVQSAEEIVFVDNPDDTTTAIIRIMYSGPSDRFAWVLPVDGVPEVSVSSNMAFDRLRAATDPSYQLQQEVEGTCREDQLQFPVAPGGFGATAGAAAAPPTLDNGISVLDEGSVGPYDWVVIAIDSSLSDPADSAVTWLTDNGYDVTSVGPDLLRPYIEDGLDLMAFRLTKGNMTGAIRPVVLTYASALPMIPIRPTAVAAQNDMGVRVWVVGADQAIPKNYRALVVNDALIDWFNYRSTYDEVVTAAADEAGGQGFVTELAGPSSALDDVVSYDWEEQQWFSYSLRDFVDGFDAIQQAQGMYRGWDGWREAIGAAVTLPAGVTLDDFGRNPDAYRTQVQIDEVGFLRALYEGVVKPVLETQKLLLSRPYVTRLYSTMSADEMTVDPAFDFNPDLADLSNVHIATQILECGDMEFSRWEAPYRIVLPSGGIVRGEQQGVWPITLDDGMPANLKIVQLAKAGAGEVVEDNTQRILDALFMQSGVMGEVNVEPPDFGVPIGGMPTSGPTATPTGTTGSTSGTAGGSAPTGGDATDPVDVAPSARRDSGCSVAAPGSARGAAPTLLALVVGLLAASRRRRPGERRGA